ncbi:sensor histidine kinase [Paenibacillus chartarius]|uniref:histidine kinase n=1 Tax=Paenibacillus chartarius TaxID=747481 RepID=A0ABV6DP50_9BACL
MGNGAFGAQRKGHADDPLAQRLYDIEPDTMLSEGDPLCGWRVRLPYERTFAIWMPMTQDRSVAAMQGLLRQETAASLQAGYELSLVPLRSCMMGAWTGLLYADAEERPLPTVAPEAARGLRAFLLTALLLADALRRLHARGAAHGALAPERVWLHAPSGSVRFCGFAAAGAAGEAPAPAAADVAALGRLLAWLTHGGQAPFGAAQPLAPAHAFADGTPVPSALAAQLQRFAAAAAAPEASPLTAGDAQRELERLVRRWSLTGRLGEPGAEPAEPPAAAAGALSPAAPTAAAKTAGHKASHAHSGSAAQEPGSEVSRLQAELKRANARIEKLEESRRHLISNLSHELRTPLTLIRGYVEGLLEGVIGDPQRQRRSLETVHLKVADMERLITDMFELTALETRQASFHLEPVLVSSLKEYLKVKFELDIEQAGHRLRIVVGRPFYSKAYYVHVDLSRLTQVLGEPVFEGSKVP